MLIECISTRMLRQPTLLLYSVSHKFHSEGQRPFSIIKRHIPFKSEESPRKLWLKEQLQRRVSLSVSVTANRIIKPVTNSVSVSEMLPVVLVSFYRPTESGKATIKSMCRSTLAGCHRSRGEG